MPLQLRSLFLLSSLIGSGVSSAAVYTGFSGPFDPSNWTQTTESGGSINADSSSITLTGGDNSGVASQVNFTITAPFSGTVNFNWNYITNDFWLDVYDPTYDPFGFTLNGIFQQLTDDEGTRSQSGTFSFSVDTNDTFGFSQRSLDSNYGEGITTISNFSFESISAVPEPSGIIVLGGLLGAGLSLRVRRNA